MFYNIYFLVLHRSKHGHVIIDVNPRGYGMIGLTNKEKCSNEEEALGKLWSELCRNSRNVLLHMYYDGKGWMPTASSGIRGWTTTTSSGIRGWIPIASH